MESSAVAGSRDREAERRELDRVGAFSDGVFAIAITLLVLNLDVPNVAEEGLGDALRDLDGDLFAFFIGFAVMGRFWFSHHKLFSAIVRTDTKLIVVNLVLLSLIALMPFTTAVLGAYSEPLSVVVYAVNVGLAAAAAGMTEIVAVNEGLAPGGALGERSQLVRGNVFVCAVFFVSVPIAFLSTTVAQLSWLLLLVGPRVARLRDRSG